jgi:hypothetical protein
MRVHARTCEPGILVVVMVVLVVVMVVVMVVDRSSSCT